MIQSADDMLAAFTLEISLRDIDWTAFGPVLDSIGVSAAETVTSGN